MRRIMVMAALMALGVAACGGSNSGSGEPASTGTQAAASTGQVRNQHPWTEEQIAKAAGLTSVNHGLTWQTQSGCEVSVLMTSKQMVDLYANAGDPVVTNPAGTAGVKFDGTAECAKELQQRLAALR